MKNKEIDILKYYNVNEKTGCWNWTKSIGNNGYGRISINNKRQLAHRLSFKLHNGYLPNEMHVCHSCDNRKCINPKHLWLGTDKDNLRDMVKKGRNKNQNSKKIFCKNGHKLSGENLKIIKRESEHRTCIICEKDYGKKRYLKKIGKDSLLHKTHCKNGHEWNDENIYIRPNGEKNCKICRKNNKLKREKKIEAIK